MSDQELVVLPAIEKQRLTSNSTSVEYEVHIMLPPQMPGKSETFPVLYMMDSFDGMKFKDVTRSLHAGEVNRFITVGISYPGITHGLQASAYRARDLSFSHIPAAETLLPVFEGEPSISEGPKSGGGESMLAFIRDQLIDFVDEKYPTIRGDRGLFGFSLAGNFALNTLFREPTLFQRYLIGSPAISFDGDRSLFELARKVAASDKVFDAKVFMSVGTAEQHQRFFRTEPMDLNLVGTFREMKAMLGRGAFQGLDLTTVEIPDQPHGSVSAIAYVLGAQALYGWVPGDREWPEGTGVNCVA